MKKYFLLLVCLLPLCLLAQEELEITFPSGDFRLNGTLAIPEGDGPFPTMVLVHGSGPSDRDQTVTLNDGNSACLYPGLFGQTIRNFKDISDYMVLNGIAVLRYDKISFTHGASLNPITISPYDFVRDVENAVAFVKTQEKIDTSCIVLAGHSQGSALIPIAANNRDDVAGLISLAGAVTPIDSLLPEQYRDLYVDCANDAFSGAAVANQFYRQFREIREGTFPANTQIMVSFPGNPSPIPFGYETFWNDWIEMADSVLVNYTIAALPTLIVQGSDDFNVPPNDAFRFEAGLPNETTDIAFFEGINHFLTPANESNVSIDILNTILDWMRLRKTTTSTSEFSEAKNVQVLQGNGNLLLRFSSSNHGFQQLNVLDASGKLLKRIALSKEIELQIQLNAGFYFLNFQSDKGLFTKKVFVQ